MLNVMFVAGVALGLFALIDWGVRTLPAERWQMLAAVPIAKTADGSWRGLNLTYYGFFSASGSVFGIVVMLLLLASVQASPLVGVVLMLMVLVICVRAFASDRRPRGTQAQHLQRRWSGVCGDHHFAVAA